MPVLPMFPLGAVLFPHMPLALRVFEPRYLKMMAELLESDAPEFGVVLIERGFEVGGGDHRFDVATVARIIELGEADEMIKVRAVGGRRVAIEGWLPDEPYPRAEVSDLDDLEWDESVRETFDRAVKSVRRGLAEASEFSDLTWPADVELADEPVAASWQLAGITPAGPLDQFALLRSTSVAGLLVQTEVQAEQGLELIRLAAQADGSGEPGA